MQTCGSGIKMVPNGTVTGPTPKTKGAVPSAAGPQVGGKLPQGGARGGKK